jgi:Mor family transcriptional regulator
MSEKMTLEMLVVLARLFSSASYRFIIRLYIFPVRATDPERVQQRNEKIRALYFDGESISALADMFDLSSQRIYQIVKRRNHQRYSRRLPSPLNHSLFLQ